MIFMLTGLITLLLFYYHKRKAKSKTEHFTVWGWLLLSLFFTGLSADEMGSIHERFGLAIFDNQTLQPGSIMIMAGLVSGGITGIYMLWFFFRYFKSHQKALIFLVIGALFMLPGILFEEVWDHKMHQLTETATDLKQIIRISMMEEDLELFFSWFMLIGFLLVLYYTSAPSDAMEKTSVRTLDMSVRPRVLIGAIFFVPALAVMGVGIVAPAIEFGIEGGDTGITRNWFPSALAFAAAILAWITWRFTNEKKRSKYLILSGVLFALSIYHGANLRFRLSIIEHCRFLPCWFIICLWF